MSDCKKHKKEVAGISDMKVLAEMIGDLHYSSLTDLFEYLEDKFILDAAKDRSHGRKRIANMLEALAENMSDASIQADLIFNLCKPYMKE